jgi:hypothetical protein
MRIDGDHVRLVRLWVAECCTADIGGSVEDHVLYPHCPGADGGTVWRHPAAWPVHVDAGQRCVRAGSDARL